MRLGLAVAALILPAAAARADGERALSVGLGYATFSVPGKAEGNMAPPSLSPDLGGALSVTYERAVGSDFGLRAELAGGVFYGGADPDADERAPRETSYALLADAGVVYRLDVLKYVPYAFAGVGGVASGGGLIDRGLDFVLVLGGGVDWLRARDRSYGVELRLASFGGDITVFTAGLRGTVRWGFF